METYGVREMFLRRTRVLYHGVAEKSTTTCGGALYGQPTHRQSQDEPFAGAVGGVWAENVRAPKKQRSGAERNFQRTT